MPGCMYLDVALTAVFNSRGHTHFLVTRYIQYYDIRKMHNECMSSKVYNYTVVCEINCKRYECTATVASHKYYDLYMAKGT
jgi:hypothetical protein